MGLTRHTVAAALVIAGFVSLQGILFFSNYDPNGVAHTEADAIAHARTLCPGVATAFRGGWHAQLRGSQWFVFVASRRGLFDDHLDALADVMFDRRSGKELLCRMIVVD